MPGSTCTHRTDARAVDGDAHPPHRGHRNHRALQPALPLLLLLPEPGRGVPGPAHGRVARVLRRTGVARRDERHPGRRRAVPPRRSARTPRRRRPQPDALLPPLQRVADRRRDRRVPRRHASLRPCPGVGGRIPRGDRTTPAAAAAPSTARSAASAPCSAIG